MPSVFVAHSAPLLATDSIHGADYHVWAARLPLPTSILVVSAHWESTGPLHIGTLQPCPLLYDFYGFPKSLYEITYPAPGAPELAENVERRLKGHFKVVREPKRRLDHGVWVPLLHMYPAADVPVLQMSLPRDLTPEQLFTLGEFLAPLRREGVLIMASGVLTHNLQDIDMEDSAPTAPWAVEFDTWLEEALIRYNLDALFRWRELAPHAAHAHPTDEHFTPLFIVLGTAGREKPAISFPIKGFEYQNLSRRCVEIH